MVKMDEDDNHILLSTEGTTNRGIWVEIKYIDYDSDQPYIDPDADIPNPDGCPNAMKKHYFGNPDKDF